MTMNKMFIENMQQQIKDVYALDDVVECGELVKCVPGGSPYNQTEIETTFYWVKDCNGKVFKLLVPAYIMWAYKLVGKKAAEEATEDFFVHQAVVLNELMCKIFGVHEYMKRDELCCACLSDIRNVWQYALKRFPYKGSFELGNNTYMFGK